MPLPDPRSVQSDICEEVRLNKHGIIYHHRYPLGRMVDGQQESAKDCRWSTGSGNEYQTYFRAVGRHFLILIGHRLHIHTVPSSLESADSVIESADSIHNCSTDSV